ncbi:MAG: hypothetical protein R6U63_08880 [Longimicrobiales bacterium]
MADEPRTPETGDTEESPKPKRAAGSFAWLWMLLALVGVGGFLTWLGLEAEPTAVSVVEEEEEELVMDPPSIPVVAKDDLADNKGRYVANDIRVHTVGITGTLGPQIYWGELGDQNTQIPILVRLDSAAAEGFEPEQGQPYSVRGLVFPMSDSLANQWGEQGEFAGEGEQTQAMFTDYYMQVSDIRPTPAALQEGSGRQDTTDAADTTGAADPADTADTSG